MILCLLILTYFNSDAPTGRTSSIDLDELTKIYSKTQNDVPINGEVIFKKPVTINSLIVKGRDKNGISQNFQKEFFFVKYSRIWTISNS